MMDEKFRAEIDAALPRTGFDDRSAFIRDAVYQRIKELGVPLPMVLKQKPSRIGKGGNKAASKHGLALVAETSGDNNTLTFPSTSSAPASAKYPKPKRGRKKKPPEK